MAQQDYDLVVIGSGASGGMAAWNLTRKGAKVLMLEAGEKYERASFWSHVKPWEARERRRRGERPSLTGGRRAGAQRLPVGLRSTSLRA